ALIEGQLLPVTKDVLLVTEPLLLLLAHRLAEERDVERRRRPCGRHQQGRGGGAQDQRPEMLRAHDSPPRRESRHTSLLRRDRSAYEANHSRLNAIGTPRPARARKRRPLRDPAGDRPRDDG